MDQVQARKKTDSQCNDSCHFENETHAFVTRITDLDEIHGAFNFFERKTTIVGRSIEKNIS